MATTQQKYSSPIASSTFSLSSPHCRPLKNLQICPSLQPTNFIDHVLKRLVVEKVRLEYCSLVDNCTHFFMKALCIYWITRASKQDGAWIWPTKWGGISGNPTIKQNPKESDDAITVDKPVKGEGRCIQESTTLLLHGQWRERLS